MKIILSFACVITLLATAGCIAVPEGGGGHEHAQYEHHDAVVVGPPVVLVGPPVVVVRP